MANIAKELIELLDEHIEKKVMEILHNNFKETPPPVIEKPTTKLQQKTADKETAAPIEKNIPADFLDRAKRWIGNNNDRRNVIRNVLISIGASRLSALTYEQYLIVDRAMGGE